MICLQVMEQSYSPLHSVKTKINNGRNMREECLVMAWLDKCVSIVVELTLLNISDLASKVVIGFSFILTFPTLCMK